MTATRTPNHHGHHPGFSGVTGLIAALSMIRGREGDAELAARVTDLAPTDAVVDVGCGPGAAARHAASVGATVTGVDPAAVMLRVARLLTRSRKVRYVEGVAERLPLDDDSASVAWSLATVHHWPDLDAGLDEVMRVLRPGGRFVAIERHTHVGAHGHASHGWTDDQAAAFAEQCTAHGFADVHVHHETAGRRRLIYVAARTP